jgi:hypothetical protein
MTFFERLGYCLSGSLAEDLGMSVRRVASTLQMTEGTHKEKGRFAVTIISDELLGLAQPFAPFVYEARELVEGVSADIGLFILQLFNRHRNECLSWRLHGLADGYARRSTGEWS